MYTRRKFLASTALAATGLTLAACRDNAQAEAAPDAQPVRPPSSATPTALSGPLNTRAIPVYWPAVAGDRHGQFGQLRSRC